jgi:hypothetical protein
MGKFAVFIIGSIVGLVLGGALTYFLLVGVPRAAELPGDPIKAPDKNGNPAGTAQIVLKQAFFNEILTTIFEDMNSPSFPLQIAKNIENDKFGPTKNTLLKQNECEGKIKLLQEGSGVKTRVDFKENKIEAPLAFSGSAKVFNNCINFSGWSKAGLDLRFDNKNQKVYGTINVETVNLDGVSPLLSNFITPLIQGTLNQNVNPIEIIDGRQIAVKVPITATDGTLNAKIQDVRAEVKDQALSLFVSYDLEGSKNP